jgi:hypothetical protein
MTRNPNGRLIELDEEYQRLTGSLELLYATETAQGPRFHFRSLGEKRPIAGRAEAEAHMWAMLDKERERIAAQVLGSDV